MMGKFQRSKPKTLRFQRPMIPKTGRALTFCVKGSSRDTSLVSDPCLFERTDSRAKIMVALYVNDISFAATTDDLADEFLDDMRKRFTFGEEEGNDIEWLLAMRI